MDFREIRREAFRQGWRIKSVKSGENFYSPDGRSIVNWHNTPSDVNAVRQFLRNMKGAGLVWPPSSKGKR